MPKLLVNLSFDHELSLGGAASYHQNLFEPTDRLLELAGDLGVPLTFYTDVCCAMRFREWDPEGFFIPYRRQISRIIAAGHEAQLHIHPHWIDSEYRDGRFIPARTFALADFKDRKPPDTIDGIIGRSVAFLTDLCRETDSHYRCIAYRAGGYNLAPQTASILSALYANGIRIDSSIVKDYHFVSNLSEVDFTGMPALANWFIDPAGPLNRPAGQGIFEVPIPTRPRTPLNNMPFLAKRVLYRNRGYASGGWAIHDGNTSFIQKLNRLFPRSVWMLAFDNPAFSLRDVLRTFAYHVERHASEDTVIMAAICHPKLMGGYERLLMAAFVQAVRKKYKDDIEFVGCREILSHLPSPAMTP